MKSETTWPSLAWITPAILLILSIATRIPGFAYSVLDWDESLYFIMAEQWRAGHLPYTTVFDNKPIGIYGIFAAAQAVLGDTVGSMRIAGILAIAATSILVARITRHLLRDHPAAAPWSGLLAGIFYVVCTIPDNGMASNTEIFMVPFTCLAMMISLAPAARLSGARAAAAGLAMGMAFMVKYVAVFDMAAVVFALIGLPGRVDARPRIGRSAVFAAWFGLGAVVPFVLANGLYWIYGDARLFWEASLLANFRRIVMPFSGRNFLGSFGSQALLYPSLYAAVMWLAARLRTGTGTYESMILLIWAATSAVGVMAGGFYYAHYFIQLLPVLSVAAGVMIGEVADLRGRFLRLASLGLIALGMMIPVKAAWLPIRYMAEVMMRPAFGLGILRDTPARVAAALAPELRGRIVYVFDTDTITYSLLHTRLPTRYIFPSFLLGRLPSHVADIDPMAEWGLVMAEQPSFIICRESQGYQPPATRNVDVYARMSAYLKADYHKWRVVDDIAIYQRNGER